MYLALAWSVCAVLLLVASTATSATINGTVFEDRNYGGGAGRSLATSGGVGVPNVRVELYTAAGAYSTSTTTSATGTYTFSPAAGTWTVRVASRTVASQRTG
ncbi:MAG: SdrD B-like domain-containing protein, partial [Solirubrobacteraceae bacterium]